MCIDVFKHFFLIIIIIILTNYYLKNILCFFQPLKNLLLESNEGRGLLNLYSEQGKLSNNGRRKVCNIIIKDLMKSDPNKRIERSMKLCFSVILVRFS